MNPVRTFTKKKPRRRFASLKMGVMVICESLLEWDYCHLLDFDRGVVSYQEQPFRICFVYQGNDHNYTPDFLVIRKTKKQVVEVKPDEMVDDEVNIRNFKAADEFCLEGDYEFFVATETQIRDGNLLNNIKLLKRYARRPAPWDLNQGINEVLSSCGAVQINQLAEILKVRFSYKTIPFIYWLIYWGYLDCDLMSCEISPENAVWLHSQNT